jgi:DNA-binding MarR family transcriptional regulator
VIRAGATEATLLDLERVVVASVAVTALAVAEVAPELTFLQWRLLVLVDEPAGVPESTVAASLGSKLAATSRLVGRLRDRGLVETHRAEADARVTLVALTDSGRSLRAQVVQRRRLALRRALAESGVGQRGIDLRGLADALAGVTSPPAAEGRG